MLLVKKRICFKGYFYFQCLTVVVLFESEGENAIIVKIEKRKDVGISCRPKNHY